MTIYPLKVPFDFTIWLYTLWKYPLTLSFDYVPFENTLWLYTLWKYPLTIYPLNWLESPFLSPPIVWLYTLWLYTLWKYPLTLPFDYIPFENTLWLFPLTPSTEEKKLRADRREAEEKKLRVRKLRSDCLRIPFCRTVPQNGLKQMSQFETRTPSTFRCSLILQSVTVLQFPSDFFFFPFSSKRLTVLQDLVHRYVPFWRKKSSIFFFSILCWFIIYPIPILLMYLRLT